MLCLSARSASLRSAPACARLVADERTHWASVAGAPYASAVLANWECLRRPWSDRSVQVRRVRPLRASERWRSNWRCSPAVGAARQTTCVQRRRRLHRGTAKWYCAEPCTAGTSRARVNETCRDCRGCRGIGTDLRYKPLVQTRVEGWRVVRPRRRSQWSSPDTMSSPIHARALLDDTSLSTRPRPGPPCPAYPLTARAC